MEEEGMEEEGVEEEGIVEEFYVVGGTEKGRDYLDILEKRCYIVL